MIELLSIGISTNQKRSSKWTKEQENILSKKAGKLTVSQLEELLGKTSGSIYRKAAELEVDLNTLTSPAIH